MKIISFVDPIYKASITYLVGGTAKAMVKHVTTKHKGQKFYSWDEEFQWEDSVEETDGYQFHTASPDHGVTEVFYVWVARPSLFLLFHETFHLVGDILNNRGIRYTNDSEEAYAYLGGWIFEQFIKNFKGRMTKD